MALAIDDFGTGYSSLAYLQRFPIDVLKIDRGFIDRLGRGDERSRSIVGAVVDIAHALGQVALAEGVETPEQLADLASLGCDQAQGFHLARPAEPEVVAAMLRRAPSPVTGGR